VAKEAGSETIETISAAGDAQRQQQVQIQIDDTGANITYSTMVRVWSSAEEFNLDFAGPIRPINANTARLKVDQRVTLSPWAAKRLALALQQAVVRYEQTYGVLEIDATCRMGAGRLRRGWMNHRSWSGFFSRVGQALSRSVRPRVGFVRSVSGRVVWVRCETRARPGTSRTWVRTIDSP